MRKFLLLSAAILLSAPAHAWVPKLEETTAKNVIDGAYGRRDPVQTYLTLDLSAKDGKFAAGDGIVKAFDGGDACVSDWLANPGDFGKGSRLNSITVSGQADQLYFAAQDARDNFKNLSVADALKAFNAGYLPSTTNNNDQTVTAKTDVTQTGTTTTATTTVSTQPATSTQTPSLKDGELRVDINVRGLPSQKARDAYTVRLKAPDGKMIAPARKSFVNDFKQDGDKWSGTLVYYFKPLEAGIGASDKTDLLVRTEADSSCAYDIMLDLGSFQ